MSNCIICGAALPPATRAIAPRYCSGRCRQKAYRMRAKNPPSSMRLARRWVRADGKRPIMPSGRPASSTDPDTWSDYSQVLQGAGDGYGIMLGDGLACIDLDHCLHDGNIITDEAREIVAKAAPYCIYAEISCSGTGLHIFVNATGRSFRRPGMEFYTHSRFIRMTGHTYNFHRAQSVPNDLSA